MSTTIDQIAADALSLSDGDRAALADRLVESLDPVDNPRLKKLWIEEASRRRDEVRNGEVATIPAEEVFARVRRELGQRKS